MGTATGGLRVTFKGGSIYLTKDEAHILWEELHFLDSGSDNSDLQQVASGLLKKLTKNCVIFPKKEGNE